MRTSVWQIDLATISQGYSIRFGKVSDHLYSLDYDATNLSAVFKKENISTGIIFAQSYPGRVAFDSFELDTDENYAFFIMFTPSRLVKVSTSTGNLIKYTTISGLTSWDYSFTQLDPNNQYLYLSVKDSLGGVPCRYELTGSLILSSCFRRIS